MNRAVADRRVFPFLALTTLTVALVAGIVVTIIDKEDFPDYGTAVWWAVVTATYAGYARYQERTTRRIPVVLLSPAVRGGWQS